MSAPTLLFLHGVNAGRDLTWLEQLNAGLSRWGAPGFPAENVVKPDYRAVLKQETTYVPKPCPRTWKRPSGAQLRAAESEYLALLGTLEAKLRPLASTWTPPVQPPSANGVPVALSVFSDARNYAESGTLRNEVWRTVIQSLASIRQDSPLVILGHSLGSVVAVDLLKRLPDTHRVAALITIGSPLGGIATFRGNCDLKSFPYDRVLAWVNVFEPRDIVTGARGASEQFDQALDIPVTLPDGVIKPLISQHGAEYYCSHPAVPAAIQTALHGRAVAVVAPAPTADAAGLELLFMQALYLRELAKRIPTRDQKRAEAVERARQWTADSHAGASEVLSRSSAGVRAVPRSEFLTRPERYIQGVWDDQTVVALAIMLASGPPAPPFLIETDPESDERRLALIATLGMVRTAKGGMSDVDIAEAVIEWRREISEYFSQHRSWLPAALLGAGVVALAATGVGLAVAAPAGLAGAALITSTLAAFGPGGMIGGMATLAALAAASSALVTAGATMAATSGSPSAADLLSKALDESMVAEDPANLRSLLASLLTLVALQEDLGMTSQRHSIQHACINARAKSRPLLLAHQMIDPGSRTAKSAETKDELLDKALLWLRGAVAPRARGAAEAALATTSYGEAVSTGTTTGFDKALQLPVSPSPRPLNSPLASLEIESTGEE